jgi:hypothetical protein
MSRSPQTASPSNGRTPNARSSRFRASEPGSAFHSAGEAQTTQYLIRHSIKLELLTPEQEHSLARQRIEADRDIALLEKTLAENKPKKGSRLYAKLQDSLQKAKDLKDNAVCAFMERNIRLAIKIAGDMAFLPSPLENRVSSALEGGGRPRFVLTPIKGESSRLMPGFGSGNVCFVIALTRAARFDYR